MHNNQKFQFICNFDVKILKFVTFNSNADFPQNRNLPYELKGSFIVEFQKIV